MRAERLSMTENIPTMPPRITPAKTTIEHLRKRTAPPWWRDAKLGIFIHWGLYSVPAWAPLLEPGHTVVDLFRHDPGNLGARLPYAEWYANALALGDSPTAAHHQEHYGDAPYDAFRADFESGLDQFDAQAWADLFAASGAKYVMLVTKHHDGYCLWPTEVAHPTLSDWHCPRDIVGELADAVRARGLRFGVYYSTGLDWSVEYRPIRSVGDVPAATPRDPRYVQYITDQLDELVARYEPSVVWADIGTPPGFDLAGFLVRYLEVVPDGTINDRWNTPPIGTGNERGAKVWNAVTKQLLPRLPDGPFYPGNHRLAQFRTPEYSWPDEITPTPWELTRGLGTAFGHNAHEPLENVLSSERLLSDFVDVVSKGGNLLLNVGPLASGEIPAVEQSRLRGLGNWMRRHGDAIYGSRPWVRHQDSTGTEEIRYVTTGNDLHIIGFAPPAPNAQFRLNIPGSWASAEAHLLDGRVDQHPNPTPAAPVSLSADPITGQLRILWPDKDLPESSWVLRLRRGTPKR